MLAEKWKSWTMTGEHSCCLFVLVCLFVIVPRPQFFFCPWTWVRHHMLAAPAHTCLRWEESGKLAASSLCSRAALSPLQMCFLTIEVGKWLPAPLRYGSGNPSNLGERPFGIRMWIAQLLRLSYTFPTSP